MLNLFPLPDRSAGLTRRRPDTGQRQRFNYRAILPQSVRTRTRFCASTTTSAPRITMFVRLLQDYQAVDGYAGTVGPAGGNWGQFPHSYHVQAAGALATVDPHLLAEPDQRVRPTA